MKFLWHLGLLWKMQVRHVEQKMLFTVANLYMLLVRLENQKAQEFTDIMMREGPQQVPVRLAIGLEHLRINSVSVFICLHHNTL
jgi:hypothetical protein